MQGTQTNSNVFPKVCSCQKGHHETEISDETSHNHKKRMKRKQHNSRTKYITSHQANCSKFPNTDAKTNVSQQHVPINGGGNQYHSPYVQNMLHQQTLPTNNIHKYFFRQKNNFSMVPHVNSRYTNKRRARESLKFHTDTIQVQ